MKTNQSEYKLSPPTSPKYLLEIRCFLESEKPQGDIAEKQRPRREGNVGRSDEKSRQKNKRIELDKCANPTDHTFEPTM